MPIRPRKTLHHITDRFRRFKHPKVTLTALLFAAAAITAYSTFAFSNDKQYSFDFSYVRQGVNGAVGNQVSLGNGDEATLFLDLKNTGTETWHNNGPHPFRLATTRPSDRVSAFVTPAWIAVDRPATFTQRVAGSPEPDGFWSGVVDTDHINPGEVARFSFPVRGNAPNGSYREYFQPVLEGKFHLGRNIGIYWDITEKGKSPEPGNSNIGAGQLEVITVANPAPGSKIQTRPLADVAGSYTCVYRPTPSGPSQQETEKFRTDQQGRFTKKVHAGDCEVSVETPPGYYLGPNQNNPRSVTVTKDQTAQASFGFIRGVAPQPGESPRCLGPDCGPEGGNTNR